MIKTSLLGSQTFCRVLSRPRCSNSIHICEFQNSDVNCIYSIFTVWQGSLFEPSLINEVAPWGTIETSQYAQTVIKTDISKRGTKTH